MSNGSFADKPDQASQTTISIDRSGLYNPPQHCREATSDSELVKHLKGIIKAEEERIERRRGEAGERGQRLFVEALQEAVEFIVAGAVLLEEIFEALRVEVMEVSRFGLVEGVVADIVGSGDSERLGSAVSSAARLGGNKSAVEAANCARVAKIFEEITKRDELRAFFDDKDLEYLEAACLLHNVGLCAAKKGYQEQSYNIIMSGDYLRGYSAEEVKASGSLYQIGRRLSDPDTHDDFKPFNKLESSGLSLKDVVEKDVSENPLMIYMKGVPDFLQCGFSSLEISVLKLYGTTNLWLDEDSKLQQHRRR